MRKPHAVAGFAMIWALLFIAITATIVAVIAAAIVPVADMQKADSTAATLRAIGVGINAFHAAIARFPGKISQLDSQIATSDHTSCHGTPFKGSDVAQWTAAAPFITFYAPNDDVVTPLGRIRDSIPDRDGNNRDSVWLEIPGADSALAVLLDLRVDGTIDNAHDTIRYHAPVNETTTVRFRVTPERLGVC